MIKNRYMITKRLFQIFLYLLEVLGISCLLTIITNQYWPTENFIDFIERMTIFYTLYQIIIYGILQQLNDIKKDEYLALLSTYKFIELYNYDSREFIAENIVYLVKKQLDNAMLNDNSIRKEYLEIKKIFDNKQRIDDTLIKSKIIMYEHSCEEATLNWKYSILIRIFK